jgi:hypothetical protein
MWKRKLFQRHGSQASVFQGVQGRIQTLAPVDEQFFHKDGSVQVVVSLTKNLLTNHVFQTHESHNGNRLVQTGIAVEKEVK